MSRFRGHSEDSSAGPQRHHNIAQLCPQPQGRHGVVAAARTHDPAVFRLTGTLPRSENGGKNRPVPEGKRDDVIVVAIR
jgi:hypothetical protein